jgi:alginate O-acetyltransferase complex protein AlgI
MQLYFDFSGYSDMAIGLGEMMGFRIPENFNFPYISKSITEFWKKWHISLGNWMRNYLYIPLGGNRQGGYRMYANLWLVFIISGFWHGAGWNFILWGAYHGLFLMIERMFLLKYLTKNISVIYTFFIVCIGFILFRNTDINIAGMMYKKMFAFDFSYHLLSSAILSSRFIMVLTVALTLSFIGIIKPIYNVLQDDERLFIQSKLRLNVLYSLALLCFVLSASYLLAEGFNPFIYFRF